MKVGEIKAMASKAGTKGADKAAASTAQQGNGNSNPRTRGLRPPWKKGDIPNPAGRPKGSRHKLSGAFIEALHDSFEQHGAAAIETVYSESPSEYLRIIASIVPKQFGVEEGTQSAFLECWRAISEGRS